MVVHSHNNPLMCLIFPSSLKGMASDWFYSLPPYSLRNFEVSEAFLTLYASRRETKRNNHYLLTVNMRQSDNFKSYIGYFQSQLAKVPNCGEDISALTFISGLQVSHPLYKHLLKYNITRMSDVLSRAQPYNQLEEAVKTSFNHSAKPDDHRGKLKSPHEASTHAHDQNRGSLFTRNKRSRSSHRARSEATSQ